MWEGRPGWVARVIVIHGQHFERFLILVLILMRLPVGLAMGPGLSALMRAVAFLSCLRWFNWCAWTRLASPRLATVQYDSPMDRLDWPYWHPSPVVLPNYECGHRSGDSVTSVATALI